MRIRIDNNLIYFAGFVVFLVFFLQKQTNTNYFGVIGFVIAVYTVLYIKDIYKLYFCCNNKRYSAYYEPVRNLSTDKMRDTLRKIARNIIKYNIYNIYSYIYYRVYIRKL